MERLEKIGDDLWLAEGSIVSFHGFAYPTRSVVARLEDGQIWVWSPIVLDPEIRRDIDGLGPVGHLVSPNKLHHLFLSDWGAAYPEARIWGPASTFRRRPDIACGLPLEDTPPDAWRGAFDQAWFRGSFAMDEIVFFHRRSKTAIVADLVQAFDETFLRDHWSWWQRPFARFGGITAADPEAPSDWRSTFVRRRLARAARGKVLGWDCAQVVLAHGVWPRHGGHAFLARALAWLG